jgi:hypothetical protein
MKLIFALAAFGVFSQARVAQQTMPDGSGTATPATHFTRAGLLATTTYYQDSIISKGLINGNYRPYGNYTYNDKYSFMLRGNLALKYYPEKPVSVDNQSRAVGILEITSFEGTFGRHSIMAGRSFYQTEQGILFANFADGLAYNGAFAFGKMKAMGLYSADYGKSACYINITGCGGDPNPFNTIPGLQPDSSVSGSGQRLFATAEYTSPAFDFGPLNIAGMAYGVYSKDFIKETSAVVTRYEYNPFYLGLGAMGYIFNAKLQYRVDGIYQGGDAYNLTSNGESIQNKIMAGALISRLNYVLPVLTQVDTQVSGEYTLASGDADASRAGTASQSNTAGNYTAFQSFGAYSGGLALKPRLTNIQIFRGGFEMRPLKMFFWGRNLGLSVKYSLYRKVSATGGISDAAATEASSDIGMAGDAGLNFAARSDLQFFYGFGVFKPGDAYPALASDGSDGRALRQAHIVSLTLIF